MRNLGKIVRKAISIIVLMALMLNSSMLMVISEAIDAVQTEEQEENKVKAIANITLQKYVNYAIEENKGTLVQAQVEAGIEYAEGEEYKPLKATGIILNSPKIEGEYPESVYVIAKSTKATNGREENEEAKYRYDSTTGQLQIVAVNAENENGEIYNLQDTNARDIYEVIYYYGSNCYTDTNTQREIEITGQVIEQIYDEQETALFVDINLKEEVTENKEDLISTNIKTSEIYNGYIRANKENGTKNPTEYTEKTTIDISYKDLADEIIINSKNKFINTKDEEIDAEEIIYKNTKINKQEVLNILGEDGKLQILNQAQEVIKEINKDTETNEQGIVEINYENETKEITIKTSKPLTQGTITVENTKAIKETMQNVENNKIKTETTIISQDIIQEKDEETEEVINEYTKEIRKYTEDDFAEIKESTSKIDLSIDKTTLTNKTSNDVILTAVLKTNDIKYNLFKNPTIEIELPTEVEKIILGEVSLLYDDNLKVKNAAVEGNKIKLEIEGTQIKYTDSNSMFEGANIQIPATIIVKKDIESTKTNIKTIHTNQSGNVTEEANLEINIESMIQPQVMLMSEEPVSENAENVDGLSIETAAKVGSDTLKDGDTVYEKEVINYTVKIKNTTENTINNLKIKGNVPEGTTYVEKDGTIANPDRTEQDEEEWNDLFIKDTEKQEVVFDIESLEAGKTIEKTYKVMVNDLGSETQKDINATIITSINTTELQKENIKLIAKDAKLSINLYPGTDEADGRIDYNWSYKIDVQNQTNQKLENTIVELNLDKVLDYSWGATNDYKLDFDKDNRILKINIGELEANSKQTFKILLSAKNFEKNKYIYDVPVNATVYANGTDKYRADTDNKVAYSTNVSIRMDSYPVDKSKIESLEIVKYKITVTNHGLVSRWVKVEDKLPEGMIATKAEYEMFTYNENDELEKTQETVSIDEEDGFVLETLIDKESTLEIVIYGYAEPVDEATEVENVAIVSGEQIDTQQSNGIVYTIVPDGYYYDDTDDVLDDNSGSQNPNYPDDVLVPDDVTNPNYPSDPSEPDDTNTPAKEGKSKISGLVWIDVNKDGKRNENEETLSGVTVKLFNANTSQIVTDKKGNARKTTTNKKGEYEFSELQNGEYLVLFEYDTNTYVLTSYKKNGVSTTLNSDVIKKEVSIDGNVKEVGLTDKLTISSNNLSNIDMGLIKNPVFDFKLDKYVSKITVENETGVKEKNFENKKLAKVEIPAKQLNSSLVTIEYKIVVTNEGEVDGYINKIVDYLPDGLTFESALNTNWDESSDGTLTNTQLSTQKIRPGEGREVTLVLTKKMTENSTGSVTNTAEIKETANTKNLIDTNKDNDSSNAEVIIGIKTGIITYTVIILIALIVVALLIKYNKTIKPHIVGMFIFTTIISMSILSIAVTVTYIELGYHYEKSGGIYKWTQLHTAANSNYWCLEPGQHLWDGDIYKEDFSREFKTQDDAVAFVKKYRDQNKNAMNANGLFESKVVDKLPEEDPKPTLEFTSITKGTDYKVEYDGTYAVIGPLSLTYDTNSTIENLVVKSIKFNGNGIGANGKNNVVVVSGGKEVKKTGFIDNDAYFDFSDVENNQIYIKVEKEYDLNPQIYIKLQLRTKEVKYNTVKATVYTPVGCGHEVEKKNYWELQLLAKFEPIENKNSAKQPAIFRDGYVDNDVQLEIVKVDEDVFNAIKANNTFEDIINTSKIRLTTMINVTGTETGTTEEVYNKNCILQGSNNNIGTTGIIPNGTYTITETSAPYGYSLQRQQETGRATLKLPNISVDDVTISVAEEIPSSVDTNQLCVKYGDEYRIITSPLIAAYKYNGDNNTDIEVEIKTKTVGGTELEYAKFKITVAMKNKKYGDLELQKVDADSGSNLIGAKFKLVVDEFNPTVDPSTPKYVTCDEYGNAVYTTDNTAIITMTSSPMTIRNLYPGEYKITELQAPTGYDVNLQLDKEKSFIIDQNNVVRAGLYIEQDNGPMVFENKRFGTLKISKVDKDTDEEMPDIGFKLQHKGQYIVIYDDGTPLEKVETSISVNPQYHMDANGNYIDGYTTCETHTHIVADNQLHCHVTSDESKATTFYTDSFGEIKIDNLVQDTYVVKEVEIVGEQQYYYKIPDNNTYELEVKAYDIDDYSGKVKDATTDMVSYIRKNTQNARTDLSKNEEIESLFKYMTGYELFADSSKEELDKVLFSMLQRHSTSSEELIEYITTHLAVNGVTTNLRNEFTEYDECGAIISEIKITIQNDINNLINSLDDIKTYIENYYEVIEPIYHEMELNNAGGLGFGGEINGIEHIKKYMDSSTKTGEISEAIAVLEDIKAGESWELKNDHLKRNLSEIINKVQDEVLKFTRNISELRTIIDEIDEEISNYLSYGGSSVHDYNYKTVRNTLVEVLNCYDMKLSQLETSKQLKNTLSNIKEKLKIYIDNAPEKVDMDFRTEYAYIPEKINVLIREVNSKYNSLLGYKYNASTDLPSVEGIKNEYDTEIKDKLIAYLGDKSPENYEEQEKYIAAYNSLYSVLKNNMTDNFVQELLEIVNKREDLIIDYLYPIFNKRNLGIICNSVDEKKRYIKNVWALYCDAENRPIKESEIAFYEAWLEGERTLRVENPQTWTIVEGMVWQDEVSESKNNTYGDFNGKYDENNESKMHGIMVKLMNSDGTPVLRKDDNGNYVDADGDGNYDDYIEWTDKDGKYKFEYVVLKRNEKGYLLKEQPYYVEFVYDGLKYTSTLIVEGDENDITSKAEEEDTSRDNINNKFDEVTKAQAVGTDGSKIKLEYTVDEVENSKALATYMNPTWTYDEKEMNIVHAIKANKATYSDIYDVIATTPQLIKGEDLKILNMNFGLLKREQPDASLASSDIDNIKVTVNGHTNVYKYGQKNYADLDNLENGQLVSQISSYTRAIYPSYLQSIDDFNGNGNELKIYVTYKITLKNASNTLSMDINKLTNYYDNRYRQDNISVGTTIDTKENSSNYYEVVNDDRFQKSAVNFGDMNNELGLYNYRGSLPWCDNYNAMIISTNDNKPIVSLGHGETQDIYIQYEVKRDEVKNILNEEPTLNHISEILSYTTHYGEYTESNINPDRKGQIYAAIDNDSAPGNATPGVKIQQYEDDTDNSPALTLVVGDEKVIQGNVFEDMPLDIDKDNVNTGKERKGNGIYDTNEAVVKDVLVELVPVIEAVGETTPINEHGTAYIYPNEDKGYIEGVDTDNHNRAIAATYTGEDGSYSFNGIVPGHYRVKFTYGEKVVYGDDVNTTKQTETSDGTKITVQDYKSTIRTGNNVYTGEYWYQNEVANRYSDALDNYKIRQQINSDLETIDYKTKTDYENGSTYSMSAYTDIMDMPIQDKEKEVIEYIEKQEDEPTGVTPNVDFGIIERPKQEIEVFKEISDVKLKLTNTQALVDGDPRDGKLPYVTYPMENGRPIGQLKIEIDNEILHGSTLELEYEIDVNNLSEIDYNNEEYYHYGTINGTIPNPNNSEADLVKISINNLIDYMDNGLGTVYQYDGQEGDWYQLKDGELKSLEDKEKLSYNAFSAGNNYSTILLLKDAVDLKEIEPTKKGTVKVKASKQLSNTTDDLVFDNQIEVIELSNSTGRFMESSTPGNYEPGKTSLEDSEKDSNAHRETAKMTIVPPTGQTRIYYVLGASCMLMLLAGIIIIKKKVLDS